MKTIVAMRIYLSENATPMAELKTMDGVCETIQWNDVKERNRVEGLITGYTLIYDERPKRDWSEW